MSEPEFIINKSENEDHIRARLRNDKKKTLLLFLLSFIVSNKEYTSALKLLAPVLKKISTKPPTPAEFKAVSKLVPQYKV
jgi:hypothetical protein